MNKNTLLHESSMKNILKFIFIHFVFYTFRLGSVFFFFLKKNNNCDLCSYYWFHNNNRIRMTICCILIEFNGMIFWNGEVALTGEIRLIRRITGKSGGYF